MYFVPQFCTEWNAMVASNSFEEETGAEEKVPGRYKSNYKTATIETKYHQFLDKVNVKFEESIH